MTLEFSGGNQEVPCNNDTYSWIVRYQNSKLSNNEYFLISFFGIFTFHKYIQNFLFWHFSHSYKWVRLRLGISFEHFRVIMYGWMSTSPFVFVSFHPSFVLSVLGLFNISPYWIFHKAFAILQWPIISYIFLMVYRIPLLILRSRILKYKICVFLCFILSFSVNVSLNLL